MASAVITQARVFEDSGAVIMARIVKDNGAVITQSDISSVTCSVYNADDASLLASPTLTVAGTIFDTLQSNAAWTVDATGFNFSASLAGSNWPAGGATYQVEVKFTPVSGNSYKAVWQLQALNTFSD